MRRFRLAASVAGMFFFLSAVALFGPLLERGAGHEGPDTIEHPLGVSLMKNPTQLQIQLGIKDEQQVNWKGQVKVSEGRVVSVKLARAAINSTVDGNEFAVRAKRQQLKQNQKKKQAKAQAKADKPEKLLLDSAILNVFLDSPPSATVTVSTSHGDFSFVLADLAPGVEKKFLEGQAAAEREEAALRLTSRETEDDHPTMIRGRDKNVWMAYVAYKPGAPVVVDRIESNGFDSLVPTGNGDQIRLSRFDGKTWHTPVDVTPLGQDVYRPTIAQDGEGNLWVVWAQNVAGDWEVMARRYAPAANANEPGVWSEPVQVTKTPGSDFHTVAATDSKGNVWVAWQAWRDANYEILLASVDVSGRWSEPLVVSNSKANDWNPSIAADSKERVHVAWDTYDRGNYDVRMFTGGFGGGLTFTVADSARFEARACITCDAADRVWIAYEEGDEQWGKDFSSEKEYMKVGFKSNPGFALYVNRTVKVKCLVDGLLKQPAEDVETAFSRGLANGRSVPRLAVDRAGGVWLLVRHHPLKGGNGESWDSYATRFNGKNWSEPLHLNNSANLLDNRPAIAPWEDNLLAVYSSDDRTRTQDRDQDDLFMAILKPQGETVAIELSEVPATPAAQLAVVHPNEAADIARVRAHRLTVGDRSLRVLRGEFHRHTEYSAHRDQDGLLEDTWRYAQDAGNLDWMGNGDHLNGFGHEYMWWTIQKVTDLHLHDPTFVSVQSYERSAVYPNGHRNVIMPRRGIRPLPFGDLDGTPEAGTPDVKMLYACLKHFGGMCSSHTSATTMGTDWRDNDPEVEPVVEIYQGHRHNYETLGAPRSATAETQIGGYQPAGFIWNALAKGYRLGFQSSSDHVSTHMSYGMLLVEKNGRQGIIDGFKQRHSYAATDNILLVVRSGDHLMGDIFETSQPPTLSIEVHGTAPVAKLHVVRNNKYVYTTDPNEQQVERQYTDNDAKPGETSYYYVRVEQADGNLAWASPMWITYKP
jgi:hypothetical protein